MTSIGLPEVFIVIVVVLIIYKPVAAWFRKR
jgi:hypothetical protein